jgi:hypothetical protein
MMTENNIDENETDELENFITTDSDLNNSESNSSEQAKKRKRKPVEISTYFSKSYYRDDSFIISFDDNIILEKILKKYPDFTYEKDTKDLKKMFLNILDDYVFIWTILDSQRISIKDFLSTIVRNYDKMFNSIVYYRNIQEKILKHNYIEEDNE